MSGDDTLNWRYMDELQFDSQLIFGACCDFCVPYADQNSLRSNSLKVIFALNGARVGRPELGSSFGGPTHDLPYEARPAFRGASEGSQQLSRTRKKPDESKFKITQFALSPMNDFKTFEHLAGRTLFSNSRHYGNRTFSERSVQTDWCAARTVCTTVSANRQRLRSAPLRTVCVSG